MNNKCYWIAIKEWEDPDDAINRFAENNNVKVNDFRLFGRIAKVYCEDILESA